MLSRYDYVPSPELLRMLTPAQRSIVAPIAPLLPPGIVQEISEENEAVSVGNGFGQAPLLALNRPSDPTGVKL